MPILLISIFFAQCENWSEVERLQKEVEAIHDAPMMKIEELEGLQKRAGNLLATADSTQKIELGKFITEAQAANDAMFGWMAQYHAPEKGKTDKKAAIDYLDQQKKLANAMSEQIFATIEKGKKLLTNK